MPKACEHGLSLSECLTCASPKYGEPSPRIERNTVSPIKSLPPLPDPDHSLDCGTQPFFTAEQMREYALAALRSMPAEPVATIRYERGTPGKENDMPKVVSCNWLPDGVYSVYATPHTEAVLSDAEERAAFELELRKQCFQKPTPEAHDLAWSMWKAKGSAHE